MRRYSILLLVMIMFVGVSLVAQDTIRVQTFTFDSITTRRGVYQFPDNENTYRKILMYYTLKCDPATTHDQYNCGEWDYLTYTKVYEHTGTYDSTLYHHPNIQRINGYNIDSLALTGQPTSVGFRKQHLITAFPDTVSFEQWGNGETIDTTRRILETSMENGRRQILFTAQQLQAMGLSEGNLNGMKFLVADGQGDINNLLVRATLTDLETLSVDNLTHVNDTLFFNEIADISYGWMDIPFSAPLFWDGESGIIFDIAFENQVPNQGFSIAGHFDDIYHTIITDKPNYVIDFDGTSDFVSVDSSTFIYQNFTIEYWVNKRNNNNWSRVFDFGNGPNKNNILMSLTTGTSGKQTIAIYNDGHNESFEIQTPLPLNEWVHVAVRLTNNRIGWVYFNGELVQYGPLQVPGEDMRKINYLGRSNWSSDTYADMQLDELRFYNVSLDQEVIKQHMHTEIQDPSAEEGLVLYYDFTPQQDDVVSDRSLNNTDGRIYGKANVYQQYGGEQITGFLHMGFQPKVLFYRLESENMDVSEEWVVYERENAPSQFVHFELPEDPTLPTDTTTFYEAGYQYIYNPDGSVFDSVNFEREFDYIREDIPYYGEPFEVINPWEIARFITPYGINLDLGPNGFTWVYDVTDYVDMLKGEVDISAGNQQELLDLRFDFIEGTPPREVLAISRPWGQYASKKYKDLDGNNVLQAVDVEMLPETKEAKIKTRLTGHGHNSNTGEYPHCCEWKDNTHYLLSNGDTIADWHIWQATECPENPVYPQGGTWPGEREGWCPGDMVDDIEWELTPYISNQSVNIDYDITDVPENNLGMGNGNYIVGMHIVQYGETVCNYDAEVFDVISPNSNRYYSRLNPICADPQIVIRNNGSVPLTSLQIHYGVKGGEMQTWHWNGLIEPHQKAKVSLPVWGDSFWFGDESNVFEVSVSMPNGVDDEYPENNMFQTQYTMPDIIDQQFVVKLKMNKQAYRYSMVMTNIFGDTLYNRRQMANDSIYVDTIRFENGCYSLRLLDIENMGLSYWAYPAQGSGYLRFYDMEGSLIKNFNSEFGRTINYSFVLGNLTYIKEPDADVMVEVFPNPVKDKLNIMLDKTEGEFPLKIYRQDGTLMYEETISAGNQSVHTINVGHFSPGIYLLTGKTSQYNISRKIVIQR
ncbi:MAG: hypothetical protein C0593_01745 [Marinilabiliales bacterium]|nr:MAG: hypothetical protein C0593_01745 [Marinilabiliales bacterium]